MQTQTQDDMHADVQEVVARRLFKVARVEETCLFVHLASTPTSKRWETRCSARSLAKCALVSRAWHREYHAWLRREQERVTHAFFERIVGEAIALCSIEFYPRVVPDRSQVVHALVFETLPLLSVALERRGTWLRHALRAEVSKANVASPPFFAVTPREAWWSRRRWDVARWDGAGVVTVARAEVQAWRVSQRAALGAFLRGHGALLAPKVALHFLF